MKILLVNSVYRKGSTGKIVYDIHSELQRQGNESVVCYGRGVRINEPNVYKFCPEWYSKLNNLWSRFTGIMYGGLWFSTHRLIKIIECYKPDIVHLHCLNGYCVNIYKIVRYLNSNKIKTILTLHAEFMHTANCGYAFECEKWKTGCGHCSRFREETKSFFYDGTHRSWMLMKYAFDGFGENLIVVSVSPWLEKRARQSPILSGAKHQVVLNGLDTTVFRLYDKEECRRRYDIPLDKKVVFHATPSFNTDREHIKGGWYVCELAKLMPDVLFIVAGLHSESVVTPSNVKLLGQVCDQVDLAKLYSLADITILTSRRETFSMITAESLCCGTPVVGFKAGGPESIAVSDYAEFVEYGHLECLKSALDVALVRQLSREKISRAAECMYSKKVMVNNYINEYKSMIHSDGK